MTADPVAVLEEQLAEARVQTQVAVVVSPQLWDRMPDENELVAAVVADIVDGWLDLDRTTRVRTGLFGSCGFVDDYLHQVNRRALDGNHGRDCGCVDADHIALDRVREACRDTVWREHAQRLLFTRPLIPDPPAVPAGHPQAPAVAKLRDELHTQRCRIAVAIQIAGYLQDALTYNREWIAAVVADVVDRWRRRGPDEPHELTGPGSYADVYLGRVSFDRDPDGRESPGPNSSTAPATRKPTCAGSGSTTSDNWQVPDDRPDHDRCGAHRPRLRRPSAAHPDVARRVTLTPPPAAVFATGLQLANTIGKIGPDPADLLRINIYDPRCGVGLFLVAAAHQLTGAYAGRTGHHIDTVLPQVIRRCVYGMEIDPLAVQMARFALYLETSGRLKPHQLDRNIICGNPDTGHRPPAVHTRTHTIDMITEDESA